MTNEASISELTAEQFQTTIENNQVVFIDFWAQWCAPCRQFAQTYNEVAEKYVGKILFTKVNIENETELSDTFSIRSIPHLMIFKEGIAIYSEAGSVPKSTLEELAEQALVADVSEIKKQSKA